MHNFCDNVFWYKSNMKVDVLLMQWFNIESL